jgi:hypothetical protein
MNYIDHFFENEKEKSLIDKKLFLTTFSITLLYLSAVAETTYQTILRFGILLFFSPIILFLHFGGELPFSLKDEVFKTQGIKKLFEFF